MTAKPQKSESAREAAKRQMVEEMWLLHYNNVLHQKGLITDTEHHKMVLSIKSRSKPTLER